METCLDNAVMVRLQEMAEESLSSQMFERWESVRDSLYASRSCLGCQSDHQCVSCYTGIGICESALAKT